VRHCNAVDYRLRQVARLIGRTHFPDHILPVGPTMNSDWPTDRRAQRPRDDCGLTDDGIRKDAGFAGTSVTQSDLTDVSYATTDNPPHQL
jgi:hypothetical protein